MSDPRDRSRPRSPTASPAEVAAESAPFPTATVELPVEASFPDWRRRLTRNLATRSDGRWEPLTRLHPHVRTVIASAIAPPIASTKA